MRGGTFWNISEEGLPLARGRWLTTWGRGAFLRMHTNTTLRVHSRGGEIPSLLAVCLPVASLTRFRTFCPQDAAGVCESS